ncbi:protein kinase [Desulfovibrio aerotolerans]|uniref:Protein kinase n=1 Tax=Solidesulfovibrio aerotolerans TaxID=295255 RepID=A0A7C9IUG6_9BACT|nr:protein kinase [Solidesulfovibrio aerotolerans]MYL83600.1 protein kinase [Solidesulfovibrio aerotolerans]
MRAIGRYEIHGVLGRGGMGAVFKARSPVLGRVVALKLLRPNELTLAMWGRERVARLFRDEAALLGSLRHPNLVDVFDYDDTGPWPYFVMELYGESLGSVIGETYRVEAESRRLPVPRAAGYAAQLLAGLARLHYAGIIHRDVKPFNLLVSDDDVIKITDLGLSKVRGESFGGPSNVKVGSPYYAAPEQEDDPDSADARSDLYAVGVTLFRMLTGRLPEWGEWSVAARAPELGDEFDPVLERSLCVTPGGRYADARMMAEALDGALAAWRRRMDGVCATSPALLCPRCVPEGAELPRRRPAMVGVHQAREAFGLDALWRPTAYWPGRLTEVDADLVRDKAAGLTWVRRAAPYAATWEEAGAYVAALNAGRLGGHDDWRLPTVPELVTLLTPEPVGEGYCQPATLTQPVRRVWSADRANYASAYAADVELGYVTRADFSCPAAARAVRSL